MVYISSYIAALLLFFLADMVWLGTMSSRLYKPTLGDILLTDVSMIPAIVFYLVYPAGLVVFAINPALKSGSLATAATLGALFGLFTYGTYDLTNQATLRNWSTGLTLADMAWGSFLGSVTATFAFWITGKLMA